MKRDMEKFKLTINDEKKEVEVLANTPLLWVIRDTIGMKGTKFGCGKGLCGACTIHLDNQPVRACILPVSQVAGRKITTIEGLSDTGEHPVQKAWLKEDVPQCGYCQPGQIMSAVALLQNFPNPTETEIESAMSGNICRCGTYNRIRRAIRRAAKEV